MKAMGPAAQEQVNKLKDQGYDQNEIWRFAKAAKSWTARDGAEWMMWAEVVEATRAEEKR